MVTRYTFTAVDNLIVEYKNNGGIAINTDEGVLASGNWILYDPNGKLKSYVIFERYENEYSSYQTIRSYNKLPKKYMKIINKYTPILA